MILCRCLFFGNLFNHISLDSCWRTRKYTLFSYIVCHADAQTSSSPFASVSCVRDSLANLSHNTLMGYEEYLEIEWKCCVLTFNNRCVNGKNLENAIYFRVLLIKEYSSLVQGWFYHFDFKNETSEICFIKTIVFIDL